MTPLSARMLIVEDERAQREALARFLSRAGHVVSTATTGEEGIDMVGKQSFDVLITDLRLPGKADGLDVIRKAAQTDEEMCILLTTAYASVDSAIEALRVGAHDYLLKPLIPSEVTRKVASLLSQRELMRENVRLRRALREQSATAVMVANSGPMQEVMKWIQRASGIRANVLITGETGTGKEVVARSIHDLGSQQDQPFLAVNLAAIPETMVESHLFGHERGSFTGATKRRDGMLRAAGDGTVFLDEIAEMAPALQAKLLRALEAREVQPLGSDRTHKFAARIIAATHRDLEEAVQSGDFREDLFYRLNVVRIALPPLRERPEDIPELARHLLRRHSARVGVVAPTLAPEALRALCQNAWRGNVRELSNVLERALIAADDGRIGLDELPADIRERGASSMALAESVERFERSHIATVLRLCDGNRDEAARELGISPATLYRRLEKLGLRGYEVRRVDSQ